MPFGSKVAVFNLAVFLFICGCRSAPFPLDSGTSMRDGVYRGQYTHGPNHAVVSVVIKDGRIETVTLLKHGASWKGAKAGVVIVERIIEHGSPRVDAVTGATNSSRVIMNAVQKALDKARSESLDSSRH